MLLGSCLPATPADEVGNVAVLLAAVVGKEAKQWPDR